MAKAKEIVEEVKIAVIKALAEPVLDGLEEAILAMNNQVSLSVEGPKLHKEKFLTNSA